MIFIYRYKIEIIYSTISLRDISLVIYLKLTSKELNKITQSNSNLKNENSFIGIKDSFKHHKKYKKRSVFVGDLPIMTNRGTFIISGIERVIVNQIIRIPGIYYKQEIDKVWFLFYI